MQLYKYVNDLKEITNEEQPEEITTRRKEFMERMQPSSMEEIYHNTKESDESKEIER